ncbi:MAG: InlB B-repeat-containing protein, partial [Bacilli bacterium]|nr:InlB B-repeat-containing protein [Bacilli bacterium]
GGTPSKTNMSVKYEEPYGTLATATRTGYTQNGWWTASSGGNEIKSTSIFRQVSNQTVYAHWTANEYTVTFNPNGSSVSPTSKTVTYDSTYGDLPTPSAKTGYNFDGWYTSATGGTKITSSSKVTTAGNHTLYARWSAKAFRVTFNPNGGSVSTPYKTVYYEQSYGTLPTPTRTGYTFKGWYTSTSGGTKIESNTIYRLTDGQSLYAQWTINSYTVTINPNGGSYNGYTSSRSYSYNYNSTVTLSNPTRGGYTFNGWSKSGYGSLSSNRLTVGAGNTTLTANWRANTYTLYYSANGGRVSPTYKSVTYNSTYGTLAVPTHSNIEYVFDGWYTSSSGGTRITSSSIHNIQGSRTIYAHWKEKTYDLYLYNNGSLYTSYSGLKNGQSLSGYLPSLRSTSSQTFDGWYTGNYCSGRYVSSSSSFSSSNNHLYACWIDNDIEIEFDAGRDNENENGSRRMYRYVTPGEYLTMPNAYSYDGYPFEFWMEKYGSNYYYKGSRYRFYEDTVLTAIFDQTDYGGGSSGGGWCQSCDAYGCYDTPCGGGGGGGSSSGGSSSGGSSSGGSSSSCQGWVIDSCYKMSGYTCTVMSSPLTNISCSTYYGCCPSGCSIRGTDCR